MYVGPLLNNSTENLGFYITQDSRTFPSPSCPSLIVCRNEYYFSKSYLNVLFLSSYTSCCWISLTNGGNGDWFLSTTVNLTRRQDNGKINSSPISALSPIVRHQQGCSKTISIPAEDSDGDKVRCRWSKGSRRECGSVCQRFGSSGTLDEVS